VRLLNETGLEDVFASFQLPAAELDAFGDEASRRLRYLEVRFRY
jgi:hypothetical protein